MKGQDVLCEWDADDRLWECEDSDGNFVEIIHIVNQPVLRWMAL